MVVQKYKVTPDSLRVSPCWLSYVIHSQSEEVVWEEADFINECEIFAKSFSKVKSIGTSSYRIAIHPTEDGNPVHLHILYRHSRDSPASQAIQRFIRSIGTTALWICPNSPAKVYEYLSENRGKHVLATQSGAPEANGQPGEPVIMSDGIGCAPGRRPAKRRLSFSEEASSDGEHRPTTGDAFERIGSGFDNQNTPNAWGKARVKSQERGARQAWIQEVVARISPSSYGDFLRGVNHFWPEQWRNYVHIKTTKEEIEREMDQHKIRVQAMSWQDKSKMINVPLLEMAHGRYLKPNESVLWIKEWLIFNGIDIKTFVESVHTVLTKSRPKLNTIYLHGPPNSFKTIIAQSIAETCLYIFTNNQLNGRTSDFGLQEAIYSSVCLLDEIQVTDEWKGMCSDHDAYIYIYIITVLLVTCVGLTCYTLRVLSRDGEIYRLRGSVLPETYCKLPRRQSNV